ncbi:MAG: hypothetical protein ACOH1V_14705 [Stenotrophomonas sp.]
MYPRIFLCCLLALPASALAQQVAPAADETPRYAPATGDAWVDRQLADINRYAARYPDAFLDEVVRYAGVPHGYAAALLQEHGWQAGDLYFACFWGRVTGTGCREPVRAWSSDPEGGWAAVVKRLPVAPDNLHWRALRHSIVASYDHWDRPIELDALLRRQLGNRAQRAERAAHPQ